MSCHVTLPLTKLLINNFTNQELGGSKLNNVWYVKNSVVSNLRSNAATKLQFFFENIAGTVVKGLK